MSLRLFILSLLLFLFAVPGMAQQADERLDSLIRTLELQEVVVTAKKIRQSGDTISYAASSYISKNDKTLEDLLRKMPGIEIKADGQILENYCAKGILGNNEAIRAIKSSLNKAWVPGFVDGKPVASAVSIPITFRIAQ